jgi:curved DNA-binding protein
VKPATVAEVAPAGDRHHGMILRRCASWCGAGSGPTVQHAMNSSMEFKDYYQILGVAPDADEKTIRQAFRKLARQYHPDLNPGDKAAEERFKAINEAYHVLADSEQRKKYDALRAQYQRWQQSGGRPQDFNWQAWAAGPDEGVHVRFGSLDDLQDLFGGESPFSDFFTTIFGGPRRAEQAPRPRRGRDLEAEVTVTLEEAFHGTTRALQLDGRRIEAKIPPGVQTGTRLRLAGQGAPGIHGGPPGDLYLLMRVAPHATFEREGDDLFVEVPVDVYTAALGGEVRLPTLDGAVQLKIPPQTQAGRTLRLRGKGMPRLADPHSRGDLYARVRVMLPEPLSERELQAFRELAAARRGG